MGITVPTPTPASPTPTPSPTGLGTAARPIVIAVLISPLDEDVSANAERIATYVARASGLTVRAELPLTYAAAIAGLCSEEVDVAFLAPLAYLLAIERGCAERMLTVVRDGSPTVPLADLFPDDADLADSFPETAEVPRDTVAARPGVPAALRLAIRSALLEYVGTAEGRQVLSALAIDGFAILDDSAYDVLREAARLAEVDLEAEAGEPLGP